MYDKAMEGVHEKLVQRSPDGLAYIADLNSGRLDHKMDHLVCFMGGSLALGAYTDPRGLDSPNAKRDLALGKDLARTCYEMYKRQATGIAPEMVVFRPNMMIQQAPFYILRPETAESLFILHHLTGDEIYRDWGWEIFQSIERHCRSEAAYTSIKDVRQTPAIKDDRMESFFLAETLKYLFLLFDPDLEIDLLTKHVFNTEAHPLRRLDRIDHDLTPIG